jgi:hypothetical protein
MDESEKEFRRSTHRLMAICVFIGVLIGVPIGLTIAWYSIDRVTVVSMGDPCELERA